MTIPPDPLLPPVNDQEQQEHDKMLYWYQRPAFGYFHLQEEIAAMPLLERAQAARELYGVEPEIEETPAFLRTKQEELDSEIDLLGEKEAYELALFMNPSYVTSTGFKLLFLRCERFNVKAAALRIVKYWDRKIEIFGMDAAFKDISLVDFRAEDQLALNLGAFRVLPARDHANRSILFCCRQYWDHTAPAQSMERLGWYMAHAAVEETWAQKNGVVFLGAPTDSSLPKPDRSKFTTSPLQPSQKVDPGLKSFLLQDKNIFNDITNILPIKIVAIHHFLPNTRLQFLFEHKLQYLNPTLRARYRQYDLRTPAENLKKLRLFGLSPEILPVEIGGCMPFSYGDWIRERLREDAFVGDVMSDYYYRS
eukprot:CAMPEP_0195292766 /NCGR_PEP_ID=MMETSP0707-20130614/10811_1 /TAXON_ID=33640 /ORGANISM="Asterionellopsis glacialis, Strain CCMP134" /LENGTH=364 /DNA_ID=CAMNT_0040353329 /DNA_START=67 /DNA_END=1161 /DNA_ORIENTATION=-